MPQYRSRTTISGRNMAGARALWRATGVKEEDFGKPFIAIANSFTQFVPGHVHLKDMGQLVAGAIAEAGGIGREFDTIAIDDGIAMGHSGMLYSLPSRELIADSVEYMVNAHCADALVCISNCDKITPGMLMAALRLNIPRHFRIGRAHGSRTGRGERQAGQAGSGRLNDRGGRPQCERRAKQDLRAECLSHLWILLRHVHGKLDELPGGSPGFRVAGQRYPAGYPRVPERAVSPGGPGASWKSPWPITRMRTRASCPAPSPPSRPFKTP